MGLFKKLALIIKKRFLYKPDAERVDIRIQSIPDWLYKITAKDSKDLSFLCKQSYSELENVLKDLNSCGENINIKKVLSSDVSRYKKDVIDNNKLIFVSKLSDFTSLLSDDLNSIEDYREFFSKVSISFVALKKSISKSSHILGEFYSGEVDDCNSSFVLISDILLKFTDIFHGNNDSKVNSIVRLVKEVETKISDRTVIDKEIIKLDSEISNVRAHVYKISDKLDLLRKSPRFRDVLEKEGKLGKSLELKDDLIADVEKKFVPIEIILYAYADKIKEVDLAKEYVTHFAQAIYHDTDLQILDVLKGLVSDLNNKRTKIRKSVGNLNAEQLSTKVRWLLDNLSSVKADILEMDITIKSSRAAVRNYIIFNEIEDNESRIEFYQGKLKEFLGIRKEKIISIENLNLLKLKEKLRKELLLISGYDAQVIYDEL